jgi:hypothetical protein
VNENSWLLLFQLLLQKQIIEQTMANDQSFGLDELYFGVERVHLKPTSGICVNYSHDLMSPNTSAESVARTIQRSKPTPSDSDLPWIVPWYDFDSYISF